MNKMKKFKITDSELNNVEDIMATFEKYKILNKKLLERICKIINDYINERKYKKHTYVRIINNIYNNNEIIGRFNKDGNKYRFNGKISFNNIEICAFYFYYAEKDELDGLLDFINTNAEFKITESK